MQSVLVKVRLGGKLNSEVTKGKRGDRLNPEAYPYDTVTPAETAVLEFLHGKGSVDLLKVFGMINQVESLEDGKDTSVAWTSAREMDRLRMIYDNESKEPVIAQVFPGGSPKLPDRVEEVGHKDPEAVFAEKVAEKAKQTSPKKSG